MPQHKPTNHLAIQPTERAAALETLIQTLQNPLMQSICCFHDGNTTFAYSDRLEVNAQSAAPTQLHVRFDIARFDDEHLVEHQCIQQCFPLTDAQHRFIQDTFIQDGITQNGITQPNPAYGDDRDLTERNRTLINHFFGSVLILGKTELIGHFVARQYVEHTPNHAQWLPPAALIEPFGSNNLSREEPVKIRYHQRLTTWVMGDMALVCSEGELAGKPCLCADLFRLQHGKITEHWNITEIINTETGAT